MRIIALSGPRGSGKDTAAQVLEDKGYQPIAFAGPIKEAIETMLRLDPNVWNDRDLKEKTLDESGLVPGFHVSPRYMAQTLGTEWGRDLIDPGVWVKAIEARIRNDVASHRADRFVITDLRFNNEAEWVRSMGGHVIEIVRPDHSWGTGHASEGGPSLDLVDDVVHNNASVYLLHRRTLHAEEQLMEGTRTTKRSCIKRIARAVGVRGK